MYARCDQVKYTTGARALYNVTLLRSGGVANRAGTQYIDEVYDSESKSRLVPFCPNDDETYVLEFSHEKLRVFSEGAQVAWLFSVDPRVGYVVTGVTQADPGVVTIAAHGFSNGNKVYFESVAGMTQLNGNTYTVADVTTNTFTLIDLDGEAVDTTAFSAYTSGGAVFLVAPFEITTPYTEDDLFDLHYAQSGEVMTLTHRSHTTRQLTRVYHELWTLATVSPTIQVDAPTSGSGSGATAGTTQYSITAVSETGEESGFYTFNVLFVPSAANPVTLTWTDPADVAFCRVFREKGFIGAALSEFIDVNDTPEYFRARYNSYLSGRIWATACFYQQRLFLGGNYSANLENPEEIAASRTGSYLNFYSYNQVTADQALSFKLSQTRASREIRHLVNFEKLLVFTANGIHVAAGDESGAITPLGGLNPQQIASHGATRLQPLPLGQSLLYVQNNSAVVRDLFHAAQTTGYQGNDLTVFSSHLFDGHTIVDWACQETPNPTVWAVRDDGILLCLTYLREHEIWGWTRCELANDGIVESVCQVPEDGEEVIYFVVRRGDDRFIEKLTSRFFTDVKDAIFLDSALSYDGRNTDTSHTMTLSGGTDYDYQELLTLTSSEAYFSSTEVGNEIHLWNDDDLIRFELTEYVSTTVMRGHANRTVPVALRSATSSWARAVDVISGLSHLEGEDVGVFADGFVVANPLNPNYTTRTVSSGQVTLDKCYAVIHAGLSYYSEIETLDLDIADRETMADKSKLVNKLSVRVEKSRGFWAGHRDENAATLIAGLDETKLRHSEGYDSPISLRDEVVELPIRSEWSRHGRVLLRNVDPVPLTVLGIHPDGLYPVRR